MTYRDGRPARAYDRPVIEHVAIWTGDLERLRAFYERYFGGVAGARYENPSTGFRSYFLELGGTRLELMQMPAVGERVEGDEQLLGWAHVPSHSARNRPSTSSPTCSAPTATRSSTGPPHRRRLLRNVVRDPDGNRVELTV